MENQKTLVTMALRFAIEVGVKKLQAVAVVEPQEDCARHHLSAYYFSPKLHPGRLDNPSQRFHPLHLSTFEEAHQAHTILHPTLKAYLSL